MSSSSSGAGRRWRACVVLALLLSGLGIATWDPMPVGVWHDDGVYVLLGQAIADGQGLRYAGVTDAPPATKFPPLYPAALAALFTVAPQFPRNARLAAGLNVVLLAAAAGLFAALCAGALAVPIWMAVTVTGLAWTSTDLWRVAAIPLSESLFLLLLFAALLLGVRAEGEADRVGAAWLLFLVAFGLVFHTRTIGAALAAGAVLAMASRRHWRSAAALLAGAALIVTPWLVWSRARSDEIAGPLRDILGSYGGWLAAQIAAEPWAFVQGLGGSLWRLLDLSAALLLPGVPTPARAVMGALALPVAAYGGVHLWRRSRVTGSTVLLLFAALWVWPFSDRRLMAPMVPWLVLVLVLGGVGWAERGDGDPELDRADSMRWWAPRFWPLAAVAVWSVIFGLAGIWGLVQGRHEAGYRVRAPALQSAVEAVARSTPPDAVVGAPELWAALHLYTGRTVAPSAPFQPGESPLWGTPADQFTLWEAARLDHVLVEHGGRVHGDALDLLDNRCPDGAVAVVSQWEGAVLVRLDWDEACRERLRRGGSQATAF